MHRFDTKNELIKNTDVADLIKQDLNGGYCVNTMARRLRHTINSLVEKYKAEIKDDRIDPDTWINRDRGKKETWQVVYDCLWTCNYMRWLNQNSWQILQKKPRHNFRWIQFLTTGEISSLQAGNKCPSDCLNQK